MIHLRLFLIALTLVCLALPASAWALTMLWTKPAIITMAAHPDRPERMFAGSDTGEFFRSQDGGKSWATSRLTRDGVYRIEFAPSNPDVVYIANGATGGHKSIDGGKTWQAMPIQLDPGATYNRDHHRHAYYLTVHPRDAKVVLVATDRDLVLSKDGGVTWQTVSRTTAESVLFDPTDPLVAYAANGRSLMRSVDGGETWAVLAAPALKNEPNAHLRWIVRGAGKPARIYVYGKPNAYSDDKGQTWYGLPPDCWVHTASPSHPVLYAACGDPAKYDLINGRQGEVKRSTDNGRSWHVISNDRPQRTLGVIDLFVHPKWPNVLFVELANRAVLRTEDGGKTWMESTGLVWPKQ